MNLLSNLQCVSLNAPSVNDILLECPITTELFQKNGYDFNVCNKVRNNLYNTCIIYFLRINKVLLYCIVITSVVKLIVHSTVGKLVHL